MYTAKQLYDLQELDSKISAHEKSRDEASAELADDSTLSSARERANQFEARLEDLTSRRRRLESAITQLRESLQAVESRLYGGAVTNPRELSAAEEERLFVLRQRQEEEDKLLELMIEIEDVQLAHREAQETLAQVEADKPALREGLLKTQDRLIAELASMGEDRHQMTPLLPADLLSLYDSLSKGRVGQAVARVERGTCQGCRVALSTMELQQARRSRDVVQCSSCRRILLVI